MSECVETSLRVQAISVCACRYACEPRGYCLDRLRDGLCVPQQRPRFVPARVGHRHTLLLQVGPQAMRTHAQRNTDRRDTATTWPF